MTAEPTIQSWAGVTVLHRGGRMSLHTFASKAAKIAAQAHHVEKPLVIHQEELRHPHTGEKGYCYRVVSAKHGNGPSVMVFLDERGSPIEPITRPAPKAAVSFLAKP